MIVFSTAMCLLACARGSEEQLLRSFFVACRSNDSNTIASVSRVELPVKCEDWEILEIGSETNRPFRLDELRGKLNEIEHQRDVQYEKGKHFLEDNYEAIEKIHVHLELDPDHKFQGEMGKVQEEWELVTKERKTLERTVQDIKRELENELEIVKMSLIAEYDFDKLAGDVLSKDIQIMVDTGAEEKPYTFTLQKYNLMVEESVDTLASRWIIVAIQEGPT
jgi:hypothetical protein